MSNLEEMQAMASLFRKKAAVMQALEGGMAKRGENTHFNYKFTTASDIKHTVGQLFAAHGLSLQMSGVATENAVSVIEKTDFKTKEVSTKQVPILRIQFAISLCDIDTGAVEQSFWFGEAGATDDKAASKCATSALKYYLISNLMIADKDEDRRDTDRSKRPVQRPQDAQRSAPAPLIPSQPAQTPVLEAHWSQSKERVEALYKWAFDTLKATREDVNKAIDYSGKTIEQLSEKTAAAAVKDYVQAIKEGAKDFN